jgi:iron complex outermembrane receptor protein
LVSNEGQKIKWVGGLYYFNDRSGYVPVDVTSTVLFGPSGLDGELINSTVTTQSYATFAQADIPLYFDGLSLTLGGRLAEDRKHEIGSVSFFAAGSIAACTGRGAGVYVAPSCGTIVAAPSADLKHHWDSFTPKVVLNYKFDSTLVYVSYSRGEQSGAFDVSSPTTNATPLSPSKLTAWEIGSKSTFWDGRFVFNNDAYYYTYDNIQLDTQGNAGLPILKNGGNAKAYGLELTAKARVAKGLQLSGSLALEHSEYTALPAWAGANWLVPGNPGVFINAKGNELERAPNLVYTLGLDYDVAIPNRGELGFNVELYHNGGFFWDPQNSEFGEPKQTAYSLLNASVNYTLPSSNWSVMAWGSNLTNTYYYNDNLTAGAFGIFALPAPPRMYGVTLKYKL